MRGLNLSLSAHRSHRLLSALSLICCSPVVNASLLNTDFSNGFTGWQAEISQYNLSTGTDSQSTGELFAGYTDNFLLSANQVTLTTSTTGVEDIWQVVMFQDFILSPASAGATWQLSVDISSSLSSVSDFAFAQLRNLDTNDILNLSSGGSFDISQWTGVHASLEFGVVDNDFILGDSLTISNLALRQQIPEPSSLLLLTLGALALRRRLI